MCKRETFFVLIYRDDPVYAYKIGLICIEKSNLIPSGEDPIFPPDPNPVKKNQDPAGKNTLIRVLNTTADIMP